MPLHTGNWKQNKVFEGKAYRVTVGAFSTPIQGGGAGTILDLDQPELALIVPAGVSIVPVSINVQCQTPLIAADNDECEILVAVDRETAVASGTSTAETIYNLRSVLSSTGVPSAITAKSAYTVDITVAPTLHEELARRVIVADVQGTPANALWGSLDLNYEPTINDAITGPATLLVYWGGTVATSGFCQAVWIEMQTDT